MKIAIKFGDNDFYGTFHGVLQTILSAKAFKGRMVEDKEQLCEIINQISYGMYLLYQNQFEYNIERLGGVCESTKDWLQISPDRLLLNEEVDIYLRETEWDNGETFILDCTTGKILNR